MNNSIYLGQKVNVIIDRPLGSKHPKHGFLYEVNYTRSIFEPGCVSRSRTFRSHNHQGPY